MEVTKSLKPARQQATWRSGDQTGRNASERRAGLETIDVGAGPALTRGRPPSLANRETRGIGRSISDPTQRYHGGNERKTIHWDRGRMERSSHRLVGFVRSPDPLGRDDAWQIAPITDRSGHRGILE